VDPLIANNPALQSRSAEPGIDFQPPPTLQGQMRGDDVVEKKDAMAELQDASEELTMQHGEEASKKLHERKIESRASLTTTAVEHAEMYMERMQEAENMDKATAFMANLKKMSHPSRDEVLGEVRKFFKEPGEQDAALGFAEELLHGQGGQEELIGTLRDARRFLAGGEGTDRPAGVVGPREGEQELQLDEATRQELAQFHQEQLGDFGNVAEAYKSLIDRYGESHFQDALSFLIRSTGANMQEGGLNVSGEKMKSMVDDLFHVQVLGNLQSSLGQLSERMEKQFNVKLTMSPTAMMKGVLALTQNAYCRGDQVGAIAKEAGLNKPEAEIFFLTALKEHLRLLPLKVYPNPENRAKLIDAAQEALDTAISKEV
jgi:type III secretion protein W